MLEHCNWNGGGDVVQDFAIGVVGVGKGAKQTGARLTRQESHPACRQRVRRAARHVYAKNSNLRGWTTMGSLLLKLTNSAALGALG